MLKSFLLATLLCAITGIQSQAQSVYKLKADSVRLTNDTASAELIIENSTRHIPGFLYNKGNGRTEFRPAGGWQLNGNSGGMNQTLGTTDSSNLVFKTNGQQRAAFTADGSFVIGPNDTSSSPLFRVYPNGDFLINANNRGYTSAEIRDGGIRYHRRLGYLEIAGTRNVIDTTVSENVSAGHGTSALIINNGDSTRLFGKLESAIIAAYGVALSPNKLIDHSTFIGGSANVTDTVTNSIFVGGSHGVTQPVRNSAVTGNSQAILFRDQNSLWTGYNNRNNGPTYANITGGLLNNTGSAAQFTYGNRLTNRSFAGIALGNGNVNFSSLPYNSWDQFNSLSIQPNYLLFSLGNSGTYSAGNKSNAITVLYNGRTQINTTGFSDSISEANAKPKAALEVVSKNSGVLLPRLTTGQRDSIASPDRHTGLLLYNTTAAGFEFFNGSSWSGLGSGGGGSIQSLKDSVQVKWDFAQGSIKTVRLSANRTLVISNLQNGAEGTLIIRQDSTGMRTLTLPSNSFINDAGNGSLDLTPVAGGIDVASFVYDGSNFYWTVQRSLTSAPKTARFNFNPSPQFIEGWTDVSGSPHLVICTATDWATGIGISSIGMSKWGAYNSNTSYNTGGEATANPTYVFDQLVTVSGWLNTSTTYSSSADCNIEINGLQAGATYNIEILCSRDDADVPLANRYMRIVCVDNGGASFVENFDTKANTANLVNFYNKAPNGSGKILLFIGKKNPADANHAFGYINGLRITKL